MYQAAKQFHCILRYGPALMNMYLGHTHNSHLPMPKTNASRVSVQNLLLAATEGHPIGEDTSIALGKRSIHAKMINVELVWHGQTIPLVRPTCARLSPTFTTGLENFHQSRLHMSRFRRVSGENAT